MQWRLPPQSQSSVRGRVRSSGLGLGQPLSLSFQAITTGDTLMFAAKVRNGYLPAVRDTVFQHFKKLRMKTCPFANLPESEKGRWGEGLTAADMEKCIWLKP